MEVESESTYIEEDIWGLGESSLILIENEIEDKLKENDHERRSDIVKS